MTKEQTSSLLSCHTSPLSVTLLPYCRTDAQQRSTMKHPFNIFAWLILLWFYCHCAIDEHNRLEARSPNGAHLWSADTVGECKYNRWNRLHGACVYSFVGKEVTWLRSVWWHVEGARCQRDAVLSLYTWPIACVGFQAHGLGPGLLQVVLQSLRQKYYYVNTIMIWRWRDSMFNLEYMANKIICKQSKWKKSFSPSLLCCFLQRH